MCLELRGLWVIRIIWQYVLQLARIASTIKATCDVKFRVDKGAKYNVIVWYTCTYDLSLIKALGWAYIPSYTCRHRPLNVITWPSGFLTQVLCELKKR
jgi:hypothetical protein